jgi:hypothetical protein
MENKNEVINNDNQPIIKVKKPVSEAQKAAQKRFYDKMKNDLIWKNKGFQAKHITTNLKKNLKK